MPNGAYLPLFRGWCSLSSGALEMLNPQMKSWGVFEFYRQEAEKLRAGNEQNTHAS